jgi:hypothetical protein
MNAGRQGLRSPPNAINRQLDHAIPLTGLIADTARCWMVSCSDLP